MKLTNFNIKSVAAKNTKNTLVKRDSRIVIAKRNIINKDLITTKAIEYGHTRFITIINNVTLNVICPGYYPEIIFSNKLNDYWSPMRVAITVNRNLIDDLDIYWDYLYDGMEIQGNINGNNFVIDVYSLKRAALKLLNEYNRNSLKQAKLNKLK